MTQQSRWPAYGGAIGSLIHTFDWASTPLGPVAGWPAHLRAAVDLCLGVGLPSALWWGPELIQIYNDASLPLIGGRHPDAFGVPAVQAWAPLWGTVGPLVEEALRGGAPLTRENLALIPGAGGPRAEPALVVTFSLSAVRDPEGRMAGLFVTGTDTTGHVRAEAALRASEARQGAIFTQAAVGLAEIGTDGRFLRVNDKLCGMLGRTREEVLALTVPDVTHPEDLPASLAAFERVLATGEIVSIDKRYRQPDGALVWANSSLSRLTDGAGEPAAVLAVTFDLSDRKAAEAALQASETRLQALYHQEQAARAQAEEASRLKDEFLATVSHELRTPLTAFLGYAQLLSARPRDEAYIARMVERMVQSARTQAQLIEDLLDVSRIVSGKLRIVAHPIDLAPVVRAALDTVALAIEAKGLRLDLDLAAEAGPVIGDPGRLQQVVWNLLANATKFTPQGGTIAVRLRRDGGAVELTVSDSGQGIAPEFLPFVFDRFRQADSSTKRAHGGLGLGLAIVRHLVELHGGTVRAESDGPGQGATFTLRLPLARPPAVASPEALRLTSQKDDRSDCPPELRGLRVLVVDDQQALLDLLYDILTPCGAEVRQCTAAGEALRQVRAWRPDVLVADIAMPIEDGYWLIRQVRALAPEEGGATPALALTAYMREGDREQALAEGFERYLPKPVAPSELRAAVAELGRGAAQKGAS